MRNLKNPAKALVGKMQGSEKYTNIIVPLNNSSPIYLTVGGQEWQEAPPGEHIAKCSKVDPEFRFMRNYKLAIYFIITEGEHAGKRARLFYNKRNGVSAEETGIDFGRHSKFFNDIRRLFPELIGDGSIPVQIDPVQLFEGEIFRINVELSGKKNQATVTNIEYYLGW